MARPAVRTAAFLHLSSMPGETAARDHDATPAVAVAGLTKVFQGAMGRKPVVAVHDLSFSVYAGEIYGLIGPNGCGKSTTMKVMLGLLHPCRGGARIFGRASEEVASRHDVGFLPENPYFYKHLTGRETLHFFGRLCGLRGADLRDRAEAMLRLTGLHQAADRRVGGYSKGMLQRIGLAQALIHEPRLLVLDEPTAGVDPAGSRRIRDLILELKERGITIVVTSHLLEQMQEVCDRVGIMSRGRMVREGRLAELISVENQTEILIEDATPAQLDAIRSILQPGSGGRLLAIGRPRTTLERLFLETTARTEEEE